MGKLPMKSNTNFRTFSLSKGLVEIFMGENFHKLLKINFGGEKFRGFVETQFTTPTNMAYKSENEIKMHELQSYAVKSINQGYQPVCCCIYAFTLGVKYSICTTHTWRLIGFFPIHTVYCIPVSSPCWQP